MKSYKDQWNWAKRASYIVEGMRHSVDRKTVLTGFKELTLEHKPIHVHLEVNPIKLNGTYSQGSAPNIAALKGLKWQKM